MRKSRIIASAVLLAGLLVAPAITLASEWDGWVYLGDDGQDSGVPAFLDIRGHGYKLENGLWIFKAYIHGSFSEMDPGLYTYAVEIDTRPGGQSGTGVDYLLFMRVIVRPENPPWPPGPIEPPEPFAAYESGIPIFYPPMVLEYRPNGGIGNRWSPQSYWEVGDNYFVFSIGVENLDLQNEEVTFWWNTSDWLNSSDETQHYSINSSQVPIGAAGFVTLSVLLLAVFLLLYVRSVRR
jgi:hypothetical protein